MSEATKRSASEIVGMPELAMFCTYLAAFVDTGDVRDELTLATAELVRLARRFHLDAVPVVDAVELIGCPPLRVHDARSRKRGERYSEAMAWLVRGLFGGP
jgi:hypothetical protein